MIKSFFGTKLIFLLVSIVSVAAIYYSYTHGILVAYNDAAAHLNTARRMIDNLTPGLVQIGSVWLPLLHIVELPFVANTFLWRTGLAGSIVSGISFVVASVFLYKLVYYMSNNKLAGFAAVLVFIANLNLLYLQTTAMFEPLLMACAMAATYFLTKWIKERQTNDIVLAALFIMLSTLTRYDGWALFGASIGLVFLVSFVTKKKEGGKEGPLVLFLFLAGFGIFLWLLYNLMIFGDALYFVRSEYSARAQQIILEQRGQLQTKHNVVLSFLTYTIAMIVNNGLLICLLFVFSLVVYLLTIKRRLYYLGPLLLVVPYLFNVLSLFQGQSVIWLPMLPPYFNTYFNARYGVLMLPAVAFFLGFLVVKSKWFLTILIPVVVIQVYLFLNPQILPLFGQKIGIITLQDTVSSINSSTVNASKFLSEKHRDGQLILASSASEDAFIFRSGIPLKNYITEGTGNYWRTSLETPSKYAYWIVFFNDMSDRVGRKVGKNPYLKDKYDQVYKDNTYQIWKRKNI